MNFTTQREFSTLTVDLLSGFGKKATPKYNTHTQTTLADIYRSLFDPESVSKDSAQWAVFSALMSRVADEQRQDGLFYALWVDLDDVKAPLTFDGVCQRLVDDMGGTVFFAYTSRSATEKNQKMRLIFPLAHPIDGSTYELAARAMHSYIAAIAKPDPAPATPNQVCYLPNRGVFYRSFACLGLDTVGECADDLRNIDVDRLLDAEAFFDVEIEHLKRTNDLARTEAYQKRIAAQERKRAQKASVMGTTPIDWFNQNVSIDELLLDAGYEPTLRHGRTDDYRHPASGTGSYSARVWRDQDVVRVSTLSTDDPLAADGMAHDAFSVFEVLKHGRDFDAAMKAAVEMKRAKTAPAKMKGKAFTVTEDGEIVETKANVWVIDPIEEVDELTTGDDPLADKLEAAGFKDRARYVHDWGCWVFWDGVKWRADKKAHIFTETRNFLKAVKAEIKQSAKRQAEKMADPKEKQEVLKQAKKMGRELTVSKKVSAVSWMAQSNENLATTSDQYDANLDVIGTQSGIVHLKTGIVQDPDPSAYITKTTGAGVGDGKPTRWLKFLDRVMDGDQEKIAFLQRLAGYALTGHNREHKLFFLYGGGRNGKSVFVNVLSHILGEYATSTRADTFLNHQQIEHTTNLASLRGARLVTASELPVGKSWNEALLKEITGGEKMSARFMRQDFFEFTPQFTLIISGNHRPTLKTTDVAMRSRMTMIPFTVRIPDDEIDRDLESKLIEESPDILRWMIEGAVEWYANGLGVPESIRAASEEYLDSEDTFGCFTDECLVADPTAKVSTKEVYEVFKAWLLGNGFTRVWQSRQILAELRARGFEVRRANKNQFYLFGYVCSTPHFQSVEDHDLKHSDTSYSAEMYKRFKGGM